MCGRFTIMYSWQEVWVFHQPFRGPDAPPATRYNIAPAADIPILRADDDGAPIAAHARWWLTPRWADGPETRYAMFNARSEDAASKPAFRASFRDRRCIIPASGFYEWRSPPEDAPRSARKQPYYIRRADGRALLFAGLWERWRGALDGADTTLDSCAILTTEANDDLADLHHRMPCVLEPEDARTWIDPGTNDPGPIRSLLRAAPSGLLTRHPVSTRVNSARTDEPGLLTPVSSEGRGDPPTEQPGLFGP